ncbi:hypothetical protein FRB91_001543 [Serendipita sp. 411]|nr:hypothetical protein FRB91_001543 [Serendipita sp. 411]
MSTAEQVNEQCRQLLSGLANCVKSSLLQHDYEKSIQERESHLASSDERLVLIRDTLCSLLPDIGSNRNRHAPISKLMDDILVEVWSYNSISDRLSISQVCRKWRHVSLGTTKLWTELDFDNTSTRMLYMLLKRAGTSRYITRISARSPRFMQVNPYTRNVQYRKDLGPCGHGCAHGMLSYPTTSQTALSYPPVLSPKSAFPLHHFNKIIQNSKLIWALVRNEETAYFNHSTLTLPMPHLQCLILSIPRRMRMKGPKQLIISTPGQWEDLKQWFGGVTPQLKEVYLDEISAPWEDRIYANLTHLQLNSPYYKVRPYQLLRILLHCPTMEYLDIVKCLSAPDETEVPFINRRESREINISNKAQSTAVDKLPLVTLSKLWYLHLDEPDSEAFSKFLPRIVCPALESLTICASNVLCLVSFTEAMMLHDDRDGPDNNTAQTLEAFRSFFSRTTTLKFSTCSSHHFISIGRFGGAPSQNNARWIRRGHSIMKCSVPGWSISCSVRDYSPSPPNKRHHSGDTRLDHIVFLDQAEFLGVRYDQVELVNIVGYIDLGETFYQDIFSRCLHLKNITLHPYNIEAEHRFLRRRKHETSCLTPRTAMDILTRVIKDDLCPELDQLQLKGDFTHFTHEITRWLWSRAKKHRELKRVVVDGSEKQHFDLDSPRDFHGKIPEQIRSQIEVLERGDPSTDSGETGLNLKFLKHPGCEASLSPRADKQADPEEQEYMDWLGESGLEASLSPSLRIYR